MKKNGHTKGIQRYKCWQCGRQFNGGVRLDDAVLWKEYVEFKQAYAEIGEAYGVSAKTVQRRLKKYEPNIIEKKPHRVIVLMDTTYWGRRYGVMLFKDAVTNEILLKYYVTSETVRKYVEGIAELRHRGYDVLGIVCDGRRGLFNAFQDYSYSNVPIPSAEDCHNTTHKKTKNGSWAGVTPTIPDAYETRQRII